MMEGKRGKHTECKNRVDEELKTTRDVIITKMVEETLEKIDETMHDEG